MHSSASGLRRLRRAAGEDPSGQADVDFGSEPMATYRARFVEAVSDDLAMPAALATAHAVASAEDLTAAQRRALLLDFDRVLGLDLDRSPDEGADLPLPPGAAALLERRAEARAARDFATSDALRDELAAMGVEVRDTPSGQETTIRR
jgi:cysteinyl-tRNA synthetase